MFLFKLSMAITDAIKDKVLETKPTEVNKIFELLRLDKKCFPDTLEDESGFFSKIVAAAKVSMGNALMSCLLPLNSAFFSKILVASKLGTGYVICGEWFFSWFAFEGLHKVFDVDPLRAIPGFSGRRVCPPRGVDVCCLRILIGVCSCAGNGAVCG
jgi:hypothetical protein